MTSARRWDARGSDALPSSQAARIERRAAVAESLAEIAQIMERLEVAVVTGSATEPIDAGGGLRAAVRAVLPVAAKSPGFDVTLTAGRGGGWAVRVRSGPGGVTAALCAPDEPAAPAEPLPTGARPPGRAAPAASSPAESTTAQLAELLRCGDGRLR